MVLFILSTIGDLLGDDQKVFIRAQVRAGGAGNTEKARRVRAKAVRIYVRRRGLQ